MFLNCPCDSIDLILFGSWFHQRGPTWLKDLAANVDLCTLGTTSLFTIDCDLRPCLAPGWCIDRFCRYVGASQLIHLCTNIRILNFILCGTGNQ